MILKIEMSIFDRPAIWYSYYLVIARIPNTKCHIFRYSQVFAPLKRTLFGLLWSLAWAWIHSWNLNRQLSQKQVKFIEFAASCMLRGGFFLFLAYSGSCMRPAANKKAKKRTEHERGALHARHTAKTHTEHEKVQFWVPMDTRRCHTVGLGQHGGLKCIKVRARTCKDVIHSTRTIPGPLFHENATEIRYRFAFLSCSVCFFLISQPRVSGPKTEHESFFLGRWSRVCGWRICEKQKNKKPPLSLTWSESTFMNETPTPSLQRSYLLAILRCSQKRGCVLGFAKSLLCFLEK